MGFTSSLVKISATLGLIFSPSFTITVSSFTATFPASTPTFNPALLNSLIIGPGANGVGPLLIIISFGAIWPAFAGALVLLFLFLII